MNNITSLSNLLLGKGAPSKIVKLIQIRKSWPQQQAVPGGFLIFLKFATTLVNLLFNERMSHLSHVKQMYSQPIHLTHELILSTQNTGGRGHLHGYKWLGPIQAVSTLGERFAAVASKQSGTKSKLSQSLYALKDFCRPSAWLTCSRNRARLTTSLISRALT